MFTGLVEEKGTVLRLEGRGFIEIRASRVLDGLEAGDSICVSGVCLTVVNRAPERFEAEVMPETMRRTSLVDLRPGSVVNLERALAVGDRLAGHLVYGHVDGTGLVTGRSEEENAVIFEISMPGELSRYMVPKGSVAVDGISLTIVEVQSDRFEVSIVPHTLKMTTLEDARHGTRVNLEVDILAKYVESLLHQPEGGLRKALIEGGFMEPENPY